MRTVPRLLLAASALVALSGCSSDSSVAPVAQPTTLDAALGELSLQTIMPSSVTTSSPLALAAIAPAGCAYNAVSQSFACGTVTGNGFTMTSGFTLLTAAGAPQAAFDQATTAAIRTTTALTSSQVMNGETFAADMTQTLTLSGLLSGVHTLNGTQLMHISTTPATGSGTTTTISTAITDLVLPDQPGAGHYPKSGTIAQNISMPVRGTLPAFTASTLVTFNGTSKVTVVISSGGLSQRCTLDLAGSGLPTCS